MDSSFKGPAQTDEFYSVPKEIIEDLTLHASAVRLFAIIKKRTTGEHDVSSAELSRATGLARSRIKTLKAAIAKRGFLQRAYDHYGRPYYSAIYDKECVRIDTDLFLSVSVIFNHVSNSKSFLLLKAKTDPECFLVAMEWVEYDYQDKTVTNPIGLLKYYLEHVDKAKKGFVRGFWKVRLKQKEARKEADRIAKKTAAEVEKEQREYESFDKHLASAPKKYVESLESRVDIAFRENGGKSQFLNAPVKRAKMFELWKEDQKNENHRSSRNKGKEV